MELLLSRAGGFARSAAVREAGEIASGWSIAWAVRAARAIWVGDGSGQGAGGTHDARVEKSAASRRI